MYVRERENARLASRLAPRHVQGARAADAILEQLEDHRIANLQGIDRRPRPEISAMEIDLAIVRQPDER